MLLKTSLLPVYRHTQDEVYAIHNLFVIIRRKIFILTIHTKGVRIEFYTMNVININLSAENYYCAEEFTLKTLF